MVDASVAVKWYLPEIHDDAARRLLQQGNELLAPDLIFSEVGNVLWKRFRRGEALQSDVLSVLTSLIEMSLTVTPSSSLALPSLAIACEFNRTVYDCTYLALAARERAPMVTADEKLYNAIMASPLAEFVLWVEDVSWS